MIKVFLAALSFILLTGFSLLGGSSDTNHPDGLDDTIRGLIKAHESRDCKAMTRFDFLMFTGNPFATEYCQMTGQHVNEHRLSEIKWLTYALDTDGYGASNTDFLIDITPVGGSPRGYVYTHIKFIRYKGRWLHNGYKWHEK